MAAVAFAPSAVPVVPAVMPAVAPASAPWPASAAAAAPLASPRVPMPLRLPAAGGRPLPPAVAGAVLRSTGQHLGAVRVHQGGAASAALDAVGARAVTQGSSIVLASRESANDMALMAHEAAHVIQQRAGGPRLQAKAANAPESALEAEADRVAAAATQGQRVQVSGATAPRLQFAFGFDNPLGRLGRAIGGAAAAVGGAVAGAVSSVAAAAGDALAAARDKAVAYLRAQARSIPGYDMLGFVIGRDPLTQAPLERNATTLLKAVLGLVPGGQAIFDNLQQAKVLERAFAWAHSEFERLGLTWGRVRAAVQSFVGGLGLSDALNLPGVFLRAKALFGSLVDSAVAFARSAGRKLVEFVFEGAMALAGPAGQRVVGLFRKIGDTFGLITANPVAFMRNLGAALTGGFEQFRDRFGEHLKAALFDWLFGALQGAGVKLPAKFDAMGILSLVLQVLGLTYDNLRKRLVDLVGEKVVGAVETAFDFVITLVRDGVAAAWEKIVAFAGNLKDMLVGAIKDFIGKAIVGAAIKQIAGLLVPGGALLQACVKIYETIMFVIEKAKALMDFVGAVVDSIDNIARGNIGAARNHVEKTLAKLLPLVISFLARMVGLGGISGQIKKAIDTIRAPIDQALDKLAAWIKEKAAQFVGKVKDWWKQRRAFKTKSGEQHEVFYSGDEKNPVPMVASDPKKLDAAYGDMEKIASQPDATPAQKQHKGKVAAARQAVAKNANHPSLLEDVRDLMDVYYAVSAGKETKITRKTATLGGSTVGVEMVADWLGPKHPAGTAPESGAQKTLMDLLITDPRQSSEDKYIRGHLLNHNLGGRGNDENMFPITGNANKEHCGSIETKVKDWIKAEKKSAPKKWVQYEVKVTNVKHKLEGGAKSWSNFVDCVFVTQAKLKDGTGQVLEQVSSNITSTFGTKQKAQRNETIH